jgi:hypothetical protein
VCTQKPRPGKRGLNAYPKVDDLGFQEQQTRLYRIGTPIGELIEAATKSVPTDEGEAVLREAAGGDAAEIVKQIRMLVA